MPNSKRWNKVTLNRRTANKDEKPELAPVQIGGLGGGQRRCQPEIQEPILQITVVRKDRTCVDYI